MRVAALLSAAAVLLPAVPAAANGRPPATIDVHFEPGDDQVLLVPATFGLLLSTDDGATWRWMCEQAIGYGGTYDPDYAIDADGAIYVTSFEGLRVTRDNGCTWELVPGPFGSELIIQVEVAPDGAIWAVGGSPEDNNVYVAQDGMTFEVTNLVVANAAWSSIAVSPTDPDRVYVAGQVLEAGMEPRNIIYRTDDAGDTWAELPTTDFALNPGSRIYLEDASYADRDVAFARVDMHVVPVGDGLYRTDDAGQSWTLVLERVDAMPAFTTRQSGGAVAGTRFDGVRVSPDDGQTWNAPTEQPQMRCVGERTDEQLFACGSNWEPDLFALARSTDAQTWAPVFTFENITGPVQCAPGTPQRDTCEAIQWPILCEQLGICTTGPDAGPTDDATPATDAGTGGPNGGCGCTIMGTVLACCHFRRRKRPKA